MYASYLMASTSNNIITLRRHDLDNLKTFLSGLVVVHHTAIPYGGAGGWPFRSRLIPSGYISPPLLLFNGLNQSFFMGLFFWISGRMSAQALSKKNVSLAAFLKTKLVRLLVPTVVNTLFGPPLTICLAQGRVRGVFQEYWAQVRGARGVTWFTATLLTFDVVTALLHQFLPILSTDKLYSRRVSHVIYNTLKNYGWMIAAAACFVIRLNFPVGRGSAPLGVQPAYLPQYIMAYILGYLSLEHGDARVTGPFEEAPSSTRSGNPSAITSNTTTTTRPKPSLPVAMVMCAPSLLVVFFASGKNTAWSGGWNLAAAAYAIWNEFSFVLIGPALMDYFQRHHNTAASSPLWQARYSFTAFLVHAPLSVAIQAVVDKGLAGNPRVLGIMSNPVGAILGPIVLTGVMGYANTAASFALSRWLLETFPWLKRVL